MEAIIVLKIHVETPFYDDDIGKLANEMAETIKSEWLNVISIDAGVSKVPE